MNRSSDELRAENQNLREQVRLQDELIRLQRRQLDACEEGFRGFERAVDILCRNFGFCPGGEDKAKSEGEKS